MLSSWIHQRIATIDKKSCPLYDFFSFHFSFCILQTCLFPQWNLSYSLNKVPRSFRKKNSIVLYKKIGNIYANEFLSLISKILMKCICEYVDRLKIFLLKLSAEIRYVCILLYINRNMMLFEFAITMSINKLTYIFMMLSNYVYFTITTLIEFYWLCIYEHKYMKYSHTHTHMAIKIIMHIAEN